MGQALSSVFRIFCDILQLAVEDGTEFAQCFGLHIIIGAESADGLAVDTAVFPQIVGGDAFLLHAFPQPIKSDHDHTPCLTTGTESGKSFFHFFHFNGEAFHEQVEDGV